MRKSTEPRFKAFLIGVKIRSGNSSPCICGYAVASTLARLPLSAMASLSISKESSEDGETVGLNLIHTPVEEFSINDVGTNKIPHIGFDQVTSHSESMLFQGLPQNPDFYFVHSYRMLPSDLDGKSAICRYGTDFLAAYENDNIFATQFHPEKSQTNGLMLLKNFLAA